MTLDQLLNCARPLYLETDIEGFDYAQIGSCTLLREKHRLLVGTARHCLWKATQPTQEEIRSCVEHLWIPQTLATSRPESFGLRDACVAHSPTYSAASDIATIDILDQPPPLTTDFCDLAGFPLCTPAPGDKLVISGYPHDINTIRYPEESDGKLIPKRLIMSGVYSSEGTAPQLGAMHLDEPSVLASYNGMSGSPVILIRQAATRTFAALAGIAVREMTSSGTIDFIPASILARVLSTGDDENDGN